MKRAQAAMEFLMTYGWAILVVLIAIGALAYFGVLNPARFLPESCTIGPGLSCDDFKIIGSSGQADIIIRNGMGDALNSISLLIGTATTSCAAICGGSAATSVADGDTICCRGTVATGSAPSKFKDTLTFGYTVGTNPLSHSKKGSITTKYE